MSTVACHLTAHRTRRTALVTLVLALLLASCSSNRFELVEGRTADGFAVNPDTGQIAIWGNDATLGYPVIVTSREPEVNIKSDFAPIGSVAWLDSTSLVFYSIIERSQKVVRVMRLADRSTEEIVVIDSQLSIVSELSAEGNNVYFAAVDLSTGSSNSNIYSLRVDTGEIEKIVEERRGVSVDDPAVVAERLFFLVYNTRGGVPVGPARIDVLEHGKVRTVYEHEPDEALRGLAASEGFLTFTTRNPELAEHSVVLALEIDHPEIDPAVLIRENLPKVHLENCGRDAIAIFGSASSVLGDLGRRTTLLDRSCKDE